MRVLVTLVALGAVVDAATSAESDVSVLEKRDLLGGLFGGVNTLLCTLFHNCAYRLLPAICSFAARADSPCARPGPTTTSGPQPTASWTTTRSSLSASSTTTPTSTLSLPSATLTQIPILTSATVTSKPTQFLLDPAFIITKTPQTRLFDFVIDAPKGSPDGCASFLLERPR